MSNIRRISKNEVKILSQIYIGQNIREEGILQYDFSEEKNVIRKLLFIKLIRENHWYKHNLYKTTEAGSKLASDFIRNEIKNQGKVLDKALFQIPKTVLAFLIEHYLSKRLSFTTQKTEHYFGWSDYIVNDQKIWIYRDILLRSLESLGLSVKTRSYVSTRRGELREIHYVISPEIRNFLIEAYSSSNLNDEEINSIKALLFLENAIWVLEKPDIDDCRQQYYEFLLDSSINEDLIMNIINKMSEKGITSEYSGLISNRKPFEIFDKLAYNVFLSSNLKSPIINSLIKEERLIQPLKISQKLKKQKNKDDFCFVLMPFEEKFRPVYENVMKPVVESMGLKCVRADDFFTTNMIIDDIGKGIVNAKFIIADLTGKNSNVFYEVGMSHAFKKKVILLTQSMNDIPFDLRPWRHIKYSPNDKGINKLKDDLQKTVETIIKEL